MSSAIERFRNRHNGAMTFDVPWPGENDPKIIFRVARFVHSEMTAASHAAEKNLRNRGIEQGSPVWAETWQWALFYSVAEFVKKHVKGWVHKVPDGEEPLAFSPATLEGIYQDMDEAERALLGFGYLRAVQQEDEKKKAATEATTVATS